MDVTKRDIYGWTSADIAGEGERLFASGAVTGTLRKGNIIGGAIKIGAARFVVRLTLREKLPPEVDCRCAASHRKRVCAHAVAVALDYLKRKQPQAEETPVFSAEHAPTRLQIQKWADGDVLRRAEQLLKSGDVSRVQFSYPEGRALVLSQRAQLAVSFKMLPNGLATGTCACSQSRDYGRLCEHIVAAMLAVMHSYGSEERRALYAAERRRMEQLSTAQGLICRAQTGIPAMIRVFLPPPEVLRPAFYQDQVKVAIRIFVEEKPYPITMAVTMQNTGINGSGSIWQRQSFCRPAPAVLDRSCALPWRTTGLWMNGFWAIWAEMRLWKKLLRNCI